MSNLMKIAKFVIPAFILCAALLFHFKERDSFQCLDCLSYRHVYQWRVGSWTGLSFPLTSKNEVIELSSTYKRYLNNGHQHKWTYAQGSPYYFFGTTWSGCAIGHGRHRSRAGELFERHKEFRDFVAAKEQNGTLDPHQSLKYLLLPHYPPEDESQAEEYRKLEDESNQLIEEFYDGISLAE